jgi:hypothetical protein
MNQLNEAVEKLSMTREKATACPLVQASPVDWPEIRPHRHYL